MKLKQKFFIHFYRNVQVAKLMEALLQVATGQEHCIMYLTTRNVKDGELILMDFGADYGGYAADLTRTVPVNGKFTKDKKQFTMPVCICIIMQKVY